MTATRRTVIAGALAAPLAGLPIGAAPALALNMDDDPWVRLCGERSQIFRLVEASAVDGNIPAEVSGPAWARVDEIDLIVGATKPRSVPGLRAALLTYLDEFNGGTLPREWVIGGVLNAALMFVEGKLSPGEGTRALVR